MNIGRTYEYRDPRSRERVRFVVVARDSWCIAARYEDGSLFTFITGSRKHLGSVEVDA
jgi:hypothetical protein